MLHSNTFPQSFQHLSPVFFHFKKTIGTIAVKKKLVSDFFSSDLCWKHPCPVDLLQTWRFAACEELRVAAEGWYYIFPVVFKALSFWNDIKLHGTVCSVTGLCNTRESLLIHSISSFAKSKIFVFLLWKKCFTSFLKKLAGKTSVLPMQIHAVNTSALCMLLPSFTFKNFFKQIWILGEV